MKILILNGSPRPKGDTANMVRVFKEAAEQAGHTVRAVTVRPGVTIGGYAVAAAG